MTETLHEILVNSDPHRLDAAIERTPMGKIGACEDVAYAVVYLASEEAGYVTGCLHRRQRRLLYAFITLSP